MKEYYCIKDYMMEDGSKAYRAGDTYKRTKELEDGWFVFPSEFDETHTMNTEDDFYDHFKEIKRYEGDFLDEFLHESQEKTKERLIEYNTDLAWNITVNGHELVTPKDSVVESVIDKFKERSEVGFKKYGTNLDRNDLSPLEWLNHLQEELQDGILYAEKLKKEMTEEKHHTSYPLLKVTKVNIKSPIGNMSFGVNEVSLNYSLDGKTVTLDIV